MCRERGVRSRIERRRQWPMATRPRGARILSFGLDNILESLPIRRYLLIVFFSKLISWIRTKESRRRQENKSPSKALKERNEPSSTINAWTSLRNEFNSLVRIDEISGSPDPRTFAKYEAKMVEMPPRTATAAPICTSNPSKKPSQKGRQKVTIRVLVLQLRHQWSKHQLLFATQSLH